MGSLAGRIGVALAGTHFFLFVASVAYVYTSSTGQSSLIWVVWAIVDFPISLLYVVSAAPYSAWLETLGYDFLQHLLYLPHLLHGLIGTIWWYLLPRLVMLKRRGGVWGQRAPPSVAK